MLERRLAFLDNLVLAYTGSYGSINLKLTCLSSHAQLRLTFCKILSLHIVFLKNMHKLMFLECLVQRCGFSLEPSPGTIEATFTPDGKYMVAGIPFILMFTS